MAKHGNTVRYSLGEIKEMIARGEDRTDWERLRTMTEKELEELIEADPDDVDYPEDWPEGIIAGLPDIPDLPEPKEKISLRLDADVLRWFRGQGPRYQSRINAVLRAYMQSRQAAGKRRKA